MNTPDICKTCYHASTESMFNNFNCDVEDYGIEIEYIDHIEEVLETNKCEHYCKTKGIQFTVKDKDLKDHLNKQSNKSEYVADLIKKHMK